MASGDEGESMSGQFSFLPCSTGGRPARQHDGGGQTVVAVVLVRKKETPRMVWVAWAAVRPVIIRVVARLAAALG
jgi:hypothetical protein